jgi:hypothetical protein
MELVGTRGAPHATFADLKEALKGTQFDGAVVTLVTDWQDQRKNARYAVFVRQGNHRVLSMDAFGPRFGPEGDDVLREMVQWFQERGVTHFYESVLPPSEYAALFEMDGDEANNLLVANANPADPLLYIRRGYASRT